MIYVCWKRMCIDNYFQNIFPKISGSQEENQISIFGCPHSNFGRQGHEDTHILLPCHQENSGPQDDSGHQVALLTTSKWGSKVGSRMAQMRAPITVAADTTITDGMHSTWHSDPDLTGPPLSSETMEMKYSSPDHHNSNLNVVYTSRKS